MSSYMKVRASKISKENASEMAEEFAAAIVQRQSVRDEKIGK